MLRRPNLASKAVNAALIGGLTASRSGSLGITSCPMPVSAVQKRHRSMPHSIGDTASGGHRSEDKKANAFMAAYCPFEILGIEEENATLKDIKVAHRRLLKYYSPKGPKPDKRKFEIVDQAYDILTTPSSPYYTRSSRFNPDRERLRQEIISPMERALGNYYKYMGAFVLVFSFFNFWYGMARPNFLAVHQIYRVDKLHQYDPVDIDPNDPAEEHYGHIR